MPEKKKGRFHLILRFSRNAKGYFAVVLAASFASTVLNALIPKIFSFTIDRVLAPGGIPYLK